MSSSVGDVHRRNRAEVPVVAVCAVVAAVCAVAMMAAVPAVMAAARVGAAVALVTGLPAARWGSRW